MVTSDSILVSDMSQLLQAALRVLVGVLGLPATATRIQSKLEALIGLLGGVRATWLMIS